MEQKDRSKGLRATSAPYQHLHVLLLHWLHRLSLPQYELLLAQ